MTPLRSRRASLSATAGADISMVRASARCDWRASLASARSNARSKSSTSTFAVVGEETSVSLASGAETESICQVAHPGAW